MADTESTSSEASESLEQNQRLRAQLRNEREQRQRLEDALAHARDEVDLNLKAKSALMANMSHELRTPLNAIIGFSELLLHDRNDGPMSQRQREFVTTINSSGRQLLELVETILDLAKIESGEITFLPTRFDLQNLVLACAHAMAEQAKQKNIRLDYDLRDAPQIVADERLVRQALMNLLSNACKFTPDQGAITLQTCRSETEAIVSIKDTGIGIVPEKQETIFDAFQQVDASMTRPYQGAGVGLAFCRRVAELHNGRIWLESAPGVGSQFWLAIPLAIEKRDVHANRALDRRRAQKALIIEDEASNRLLAREMLDAAGFVVFEADNGADGVALAARRRPDVILLDIQMPGMDGRETLRLLRAGDQTRAIPVIALTAYAMAEDRQRFLDDGFDGYISKPIEMASFRESLSAVLD